MYEAEGDVPVRLNVEKVGIFWSIIRDCAESISNTVTDSERPEG